MVSGTPEKKSGCGLLDAVFGRRGFWTKKAATAHSQLQPDGPAATVPVADGPSPAPSGGDHGHDRIIPRPGPNHTKQQQQQPTPHHPNENPGRKPRNSETTLATSAPPRPTTPQKLPKESIGISGELETLISNYQTAKGGTGLVRASSSNVMLFGNMGNLRQPANCNYLPHDAPAPRKAAGAPPPASMCRAISTRMDPETLKIMGNEDFKNGRFEEALALYDAAISIEPDKASYRSNKSAALTALGRIMEALFECREAIRIDPHYQRAHQRLGRLYLRLGEGDKALYHYKHAGSEVDPDDIAKGRNLQTMLNKCTEAKRQRDWSALITVTSDIISTCADSAPQIYALKAEALLRQRRLDEADETLKRGPNMDAEECTKFLGPYGSANVFLVQAQVHMSAGRFDDAVAAAQRAARLDPNNREAGAVAQRARAVAAARCSGNERFKAFEFAEACGAYDEGLLHDPSNPVLLCNRAACRSKLGRLREAADDCTAALNQRPSYSKARLRRADCFAKMQMWEASVEDYRALERESPGDEEVRQRLEDARGELKRQRGE